MFVFLLFVLRSEKFSAFLQ